MNITHHPDHNFVGLYASDSKPRYRVERVNNPLGFYAQNSRGLAQIGADAFGQPVCEFAPQVEERFKKAEFAHAMYFGASDKAGHHELVGFGLFDTLRGQHWRFTFDRG